MPEQLADIKYLTCAGRSVSRRGRRRVWRVTDKFVGPGDKVLHIRGVGMAAVMLAPGQLAIEHADVHLRHLLGMVVI